MSIRFISVQIHHVWDTYKPSEIDILGFTHGITQHLKFSRGDNIDEINQRECGGTHIPAVFDYLAEKSIRPEVLVILSDMYSDIPQTSTRISSHFGLV